ncbi:hypothetical protein [Galactobacter valiniphilus]|uniref:hypothetical protein n=1 Tax=Galactobacter valiniphilus TaxID=2676122 RepID=UPI003734E617
MNTEHHGAGPGSGDDGADASQGEGYLQLVAEEWPWAAPSGRGVADARAVLGAKTLAEALAWSLELRTSTGLRDRQAGARVAQRAADESGLTVMDDAGTWHWPGGEAVRVRHDAVRFLGEYGDQLPWWGLYNWPDNDADPLEAHELRTLGASEELIAAGRAWTARWDAWATSGWDETRPWPGGEAAHAAEGEALDAEGAELVERTVRECPRLWVLDREQQWHGGVLALGGDWEPGGPYRHDGWEPVEGPTLVLYANGTRGGPWGVRGTGDKVNPLPSGVPVPVEAAAAGEAWLAANTAWEEASLRLDLEAVERGDAEALAAAERLKALAEDAWRLAWEALGAMSEAVGWGSGITVQDVSGRTGGPATPPDPGLAALPDYLRERELRERAAREREAPFAAAILATGARARRASTAEDTYYSASYERLTPGQEVPWEAVAPRAGEAFDPLGRSEGEIADDEPGR